MSEFGKLNPTAAVVPCCVPTLHWLMCRAAIAQSSVSELSVEAPTSNVSGVVVSIPDML